MSTDRSSWALWSPDILFSDLTTHRPGKEQQSSLEVHRHFGCWCTEPISILCHFSLGEKWNGVDTSTSPLAVIDRSVADVPYFTLEDVMFVSTVGGAPMYTCASDGAVFGYDVWLAMNAYYHGRHFVSQFVQHTFITDAATICHYRDRSLQAIVQAIGCLQYLQPQLLSVTELFDTASESCCNFWQQTSRQLTQKMGMNERSEAHRVVASCPRHVHGIWPCWCEMHLHVSVDFSPWEAFNNRACECSALMMMMMRDIFQIIFWQPLAEVLLLQLSSQRPSLDLQLKEIWCDVQVTWLNKLQVVFDAHGLSCVSLRESI